MTEGLKPIPTEYKGVRYKSKSEAMFAFALDRTRLLWKYDPAYFVTSDNWVADFHLCWRGDSSIWNAALEYKPHAITNTYRTILAGRFEELQARFLELPFIGLLAVGNPYDREYQVEAWDWDEDSWLKVPWLKNEIFNHIGGALNYRFEFKEADPQ